MKAMILSGKSPMLYEQLLRKCRFVLFVLFAASIVLPLKDGWSQEQSKSSMPDMSNFFDSEIEPIPDNERPVEPRLFLPDTLEKVPLPASANERQELASWVRWLVLRNLPPSFEDNRKWSREKDVFNGVTFRREGWKIETKRKTKTVKHGTWSRYYIEFVDPAKNLQVDIQKIDYPKPGTIRVVTQVIAPLKLFGRMSQWQRDIQLISLSANADATIELNVVSEIQVIVNPLRIPPDVEFRPVVTDARVALRDFEVHSISQLHGPLAELLGKGIREVLDNRLEDYREKLVVKMNLEITKQKGKLKLSMHDWLQSSIKKNSD